MVDERQLSRELLEFIKNSPTAFQATDNVAQMLTSISDVSFTVRGGSSLMAYRLPESVDKSEVKKMPKGFHIICAHTDSPMFKIKENPESKDGNGYVKVNVEKYGGMIVNSWLDRPLSVAGRVVYEQNGELVSASVDLKKPYYIIPNLAIHMSRGSDDKPLSIQTDLQPIGDEGLYDAVADYVSEKTGSVVGKEDILGADLYVYNCQEGCLVGGKASYVCSPRLDDLQCVFAAVKAFLEAESKDYINVLAVFDNEEVGSLSRQGAASDYLQRTLEEIAEKLGVSGVAFNAMLDASFMISADNAHAVHPNHPEKADAGNRPHINGGIVIKYHGGQKYTTDAYSGAFMKKLCQDNGIPYQTYHNHSDVAGGSTLGNLVMANVSIPTADIGAPQLAMHSAYETTGVKDTTYLNELMKAFYNL